MRDHLDILRRTSHITGGITDQWSLVHVALAAVRLCGPETWVDSFKSVNLHPKFRTDFAAWCKKIAPSLQTGESFYQPAHPDHVWDLLPAFFRGMDCAQRQLLISTIDKYADAAFSVDCVKDVMATCHVPLRDMQHARVCYEVRIKLMRQKKY